MKKIGIVGGVSWYSTVEYYRAICELSHARVQDRGPEGPPAIPEMAIESLNINRSFNLRGRPGDDASWRHYDAYFQTALRRLEASGVDFAIIASNTPHNRYDAITQGIGIPVLSIFEAVAKECGRHGVDDALILGTAPTMSSPVFPALLARHGIHGAVPASDEDQALVVELIDRLQAGESRGAAEEVRRIVEKSLPVSAGKRPAVCMSCTELPLAFPGMSDASALEITGVLYLNTTYIHAKAAFDYALSTNDA